MNRNDSLLDVISVPDLTQVTGGENKIILQGNLEDQPGHYVNCEPLAGGAQLCGEFVNGKNEALRTWKMLPYVQPQ